MIEEAAMGLPQSLGGDPRRLCPLLARRSLQVIAFVFILCKSFLLDFICV